MNSWWPTSPKPGNLGDILTPWMMRRDGVEPRFVGTDYCGKVLGIGSTLRFAQKYDQVWTTGIMRRSDGPYPIFAEYLALRGPMSFAAVGLEQPVPLGDGALCLPRYYAPRITATIPLGVVPHYIDMKHRDEWPSDWKNGAAVISTLTADVPAFVDQIVQCERIESSSLHGCLVAMAYGIPAKWVRLGDRLSGDDVKFEDAFAGARQANVDDLMNARPWRAETEGLTTESTECTETEGSNLR